MHLVCLYCSHVVVDQRIFTFEIIFGGQISHNHTLELLGLISSRDRIEEQNPSTSPKTEISTIPSQIHSISFFTKNYIHKFRYTKFRPISVFINEGNWKYTSQNS